ncbi:hypothetical protein K3495_g17454, partial [Podosphaera aphanis]
SRSCLARPTRSGPVTKEQLITIRQASQREFAAVARAKAAVKRSEAAAIAAAVQNPASPPALPTSNQFKVLAEDTILPDAEFTGETNPKHIHEGHSTSPFAPPSYSKFYVSQCRQRRFNARYRAFPSLQARR